MRVAVNALSARMGGGQTYLINLLARLPDEPDLRLLVYAPADLDLPVDSRIERRFPAWPVTNPLLRAIWERFVLPRTLRKWHAKVLFCPGGLLVTSPPGCRTATMFRNMIPFDTRARAAVSGYAQRLRNVILRRELLRSLVKADLSIFVSDHARRVIEALHPVPRPVTIPHGIHPAFRAGADETGQLGPSAERALQSVRTERFLLYVSKVDAYKHHFEVVQAYSRLPHRLKEAYTLVLVGENDGVLGDRVRAEIERQGSSERVILTGPIPYRELPGVYARASLVVFASSCENCPNILLEALASSRPIVCSDVMPMPEFGLDAVEYFSPFDPDSIASVIVRVLDSPDYAATLAERAGRRSLDFDWDKAAKETWRALRETADA